MELPVYLRLLVNLSACGGIHLYRQCHDAALEYSTRISHQSSLFVCVSVVQSFFRELPLPVPESLKPVGLKVSHRATCQLKLDPARFQPKTRASRSFFFSR